MDEAQALIDIVSGAVSRGAVDVELLAILGSGFSIPAEDRSVSREHLLRIYSRRLRRCPPGSFLLAETERLVQVLASHEGDRVKMISVRQEGSTKTLVLLGCDNRFLFWSPIWRFPSDVPAGGPVHAQLVLMRALVSGEITAPEFDDRWWALRRAALDAGQEPNGPLGHALRLASSAAEDYVADPDLRDPGDLDDQQLITAIEQALSTLSPQSDD